MAMRNFYYVREVAALLGVTTQIVTRRIHAGKIQAGRAGKGRWRIDAKGFRQYAADNNLVLDWEALIALKRQKARPVSPAPEAEIPEGVTATT